MVNKQYNIINRTVNNLRWNDYEKMEKTEITVSKIIEAAMQEFGQNGYAGGTVNNICKSGINKGLLYHNFSGKDELYLTCLRRSSSKLIRYIREREGTDHLENYMAARMDFFHDFPREARIFFDALLNPPIHLSEDIRQSLADFNALNEKIYEKTLDTLLLRDGISRADAISYFHLLQLMLNGYFSSPAFQSATWQEKAELHEKILPKLFDCMLYGIAKGEK